MTSVSIETVGSVGYLTLAKPATLNAITLEMINLLHQGLLDHEQNPSVLVIVLRSSSEKAFCAGGDMKRLRQFVLDQDQNSVKDFFTKEYALNLAIAECSKPYISLIDGVAMGGGLGLSVHGQFVVVTENSLMAMPESRIGFFPDVGASYFLQDLPFNSGLWLALTASPVKGQQAVQVGLATHFIKRDKLPDLLTQLEGLNQKPAKNSEQGNVDNARFPRHLAQNCLDRFSENSVDNDFNELLQQRERWFSGNSIESINIRLHDASSSSNDAGKLLMLMDKGSPHSYAITLSLFEKNKGVTLRDCLAAELELSVQAAFHPDLIEGVRAVLVDKDHNAAWS